jgi:chromosome segregation ATPase
VVELYESVSAFNEVLQDKDKPLSLLKRITNIRAPRKQAKLSPAELLIQLSLRKRASAFVDARDDLETKIGRLSRRLNFLLTESDLWREKFVQFEAYAEKLSTEAVELRNKINKEQRESRRLTSIVTMTSQEKARLQLRTLFSFFIPCVDF